MPSGRSFSTPTNRSFTPRTNIAPNTGGSAIPGRGNIPAQRGAGPGTINPPNTFTRPGGIPSINGRGNRGVTPGGSTNPNAIGQPGRGQRTPGTLPGVTNGRGNRGVTPGGVTNPNAIGQPGRGQRTTGTLPGTINGRGNIGQGGQGRGPQGQGFRPGQARQQWNQNWDRNHGNWNHNGNWNNNNNWGWNNSSFLAGFFFYPAFAFGFNYGYWGFDDCGAYCSYSPFYYYGYPYVYAPRVVVADVPAYSYTPAPDYSYGSGYYLSPGSYNGLDAALSDIRNAWVNGRADLMLKYINANTQIAIYLDNDYSYSLPGSDYSSMVRDAIGHIRTVNLTFDKVEQRSDGAYTASGTHEFYDANNNHKVVNVSFTLAQSNGAWVLVAAGSSDMAST